VGTRRVITPFHPILPTFHPLPQTPSNAPGYIVTPSPSKESNLEKKEIVQEDDLTREVESHYDSGGNHNWTSRPLTRIILAARFRKGETFGAPVGIV
jgi:hypothetical protein